MELKKIQKIAYGILNILGEEYLGDRVDGEQMKAYLSGIYSIEASYIELSIAVSYFIDFVRDYQDEYIPDIGYIPDLIKIGRVPNSWDIDWNSICRVPVRVEITTDEPYLLIGWLEILKDVINEKEFTDKYLPSAKYDGSYDINYKYYPTNNEEEEFDDDDYSDDNDDYHVEEEFDDDDYSDDNDDYNVENDNFKKDDRCKYIFTDEDDIDFDREDIDPMEVRRDEWGNLYTVGGQMWERAMNKRNDDDD